MIILMVDYRDGVINPIGAATEIADTSELDVIEIVETPLIGWGIYTRLIKTDNAYYLATT